MSDYKIGDRVKVRPEVVENFLQPWRSRFASGREGTVIQGPSPNIRGYLVQWDAARYRRASDWQLALPASDLLPATPQKDATP